VRRSHNRCLELFGAYHNLIEVGHLTEPQQDAVAGFGVRVDEESVVVFHIAVMQLQDECAASEQPLVLSAPMITAETEQLLVPPA
jgi:hypothetical protein